MRKISTLDWIALVAFGLAIVAIAVWAAQLWLQIKDGGFS